MSMAVQRSLLSDDQQRPTGLSSDRRSRQRALAPRLCPLRCIRSWLMVRSGRRGLGRRAGAPPGVPCRYAGSTRSGQTLIAYRFGSPALATAAFFGIVTDRSNNVPAFRDGGDFSFCGFTGVTENSGTALMAGRVFVTGFATGFCGVVTGLALTVVVTA